MSCAIKFPTPQEIYDRTAADFSSIVLGGLPIIPESNEAYLVSLLSAQIMQNQMFIQGFANEQNPETASCEGLYALAGRDGFLPKGAEGAQGYVKVTGVPGTTIPEQLNFLIGGDKYVTNGAMAKIMPPSGYIYVQVLRLQLGEYQGDSPKTGEIVDPPAGLDSEVEVLGNFCGGRNVEDCESFRIRYLNHLRVMETANINWLFDKLLEWPCVTGACQAPVTDCQDGGTSCPNEVHLYVLFRNTFPCGLAPECVVQNITDWLFGTPQGYGAGQAPFGMCGRVHYVKPVEIDIRISGLRCFPSVSIDAVKTALYDYVDYLCPSTNFILDEARLRILNIIGTSQGISLSTDLLNETGGSIDNCGNVIPNIHYKVCLRDVIFTDSVGELPPCALSA